MKDTRISIKQNKAIVMDVRCKDDVLINLTGNGKEISCEFCTGESVSLCLSLCGSHRCSQNIS